MRNSSSAPPFLFFCLYSHCLTGANMTFAIIMHWKLWRQVPLSLNLYVQNTYFALSRLSLFTADQTSELYLQHLFIPAGHPAVSQTSVPEQWLSLSHHISCWQQSDWEFQTDRDHSQDGSSLQARPGPHSLSLSQSPSLSWHLPPPASTEVQHDPWLVALAPQWCLGTYRVTT